MFTELSPLLKKGDTLVLQISLIADAPVVADRKLQVNVIPKLFTLDGQHGEDRKALSTPLQLSGTVAELDSPEFAATLTRFATSGGSLRQTIDDVEAAHKHAAASKVKPKDTPKPAEKKSEAKGAKSATPEGAAEAPDVLC